MSRTAIALKFKMLWFPDEASYWAESKQIEIYSLLYLMRIKVWWLVSFRFQKVMTSGASQEYCISERLLDSSIHKIPINSHRKRSYEIYHLHTMETLLSGHPRGKWDVPLNRGSQRIRLVRNYQVTQVKRQFIELQTCLRAFDFCCT